MKIHDLSWPISEKMTAYKDKKVVKITQVKGIEVDGVVEHKLVLSTHTGTHIDAPAHFMQGGMTIDEIPLESLVGECQVLDLTHVTEKITKEDLEKFDIVNNIILLKTTNSDLSPDTFFNYEFVYLDKSGAEYLASKDIKAVGIDYLGIERGQPDHESHNALFSKKVPIIEGLRLFSLQMNNYFLYCLPLSVIGVEAAPARVIAIEK